MTQTGQGLASGGVGWNRPVAGRTHSHGGYGGGVRVRAGAAGVGGRGGANSGRQVRTTGQGRSRKLMFGRSG